MLAKQMQDIGTKDKITDTIKRAKDKEDSFRLMGFGHRCGVSWLASHGAE